MRNSVFSGLSGKTIADLIERKEVDPKHLHRKERLLVVAALSPMMTQTELGDFLHVTDRTIRKDERILEENAAGLVDKVSINRQAGNVLRLARVLQAKAIRSGNLELAWRIEREKNDELRKFGFKLSPEQQGAAGSDGSTIPPAPPGAKQPTESELLDADLLSSIRSFHTQDPH